MKMFIISLSVRPLGLHYKSHVIVMCISSVKPVLWLVVNLHQISDGAEYTEP